MLAVSNFLCDSAKLKTNRGILVPSITRPATNTAKVATSSVKSTIAPKQRPVVHPRLKAAQEKPEKKAIGSTVKKQVVRKPAVAPFPTKRASAPSPEELVVVTDGQKTMLKPESSKLSVYHNILLD